MTTSLLVTAVKRRLVDVWTDVLSGEGVTVAYGPLLVNVPRELVVLHDVRTTDDEPEAMTGSASRKPARHDFTLEGVIGCRQIGQTAESGEQRVESLFNLMKNATVDPSVAGPNLYGAGTYEALSGLLWVWLRPGDVQTDHVKGAGWQSTLTFFVDVRTRLT